MDIKISEIKEVLSHFSDDDMIVLDGVYKSNITVIRKSKSYGRFAQVQFRKEDKEGSVSITITGDVD